MSLTVAQAKLQQSMKELVVHWQQASDVWNDPVSKRFEERYLAPLEPRVRAALSAMNTMNELVMRARSDCS